MAISAYCNYQERCHQEVRDKLYSLGCHKEEVEQHIAALIETGLLNEERYARAIARGKFRIKQWGRNKIVSLLTQNKVSAYCIKKALTEIDANEYYGTMLKLAREKWEQTRGERSVWSRKARVFRYMVQKGYESALVYEVVDEIIRDSAV